MVSSVAAPLIVYGFRRVRRSKSTEAQSSEGQPTAASGADSVCEPPETAKDASTHASPDAPECLHHRRRCTGHDRRTAVADRAGARPYHCALSVAARIHPKGPLTIQRRPRRYRLSHL
jgi:hypothetical protein